MRQTFKNAKNVKSTFSKSFGVSIHGSDLSDFVSNYDNDLDEVDNENELFQFGNCAMEYWRND